MAAWDVRPPPTKFIRRFVTGLVVFSSLKSTANNLGLPAFKLSTSRLPTLMRPLPQNAIGAESNQSSEMTMLVSVVPSEWLTMQRFVTGPCPAEVRNESAEYGAAAWGV